MYDMAATDDASIGIDVVCIFTSVLFVDGEGRSVGLDGNIVRILAQKVVPDRRYKAIWP
jgi:hypothetical protein